MQDVPVGDVRVAHVSGGQIVTFGLVVGRRAVGGTRAIPTRRANDVAPAWISSSHGSSRSTGSASCTT